MMTESEVEVPVIAVQAVALGVGLIGVMAGVFGGLATLLMTPVGKYAGGPAEFEPRVKAQLTLWWSLLHVGVIVCLGSAGASPLKNLIFNLGLAMAYFAGVVFVRRVVWLRSRGYAEDGLDAILITCVAFFAAGISGMIFTFLIA